MDLFHITYKMGELSNSLEKKLEELSGNLEVVGLTSAHQNQHISNYLVILNKAAFEFWSSADPEDKNTHPTNKEVFNWLKLQGLSDISAKQGAVIIRPEWAASGRRPTK